jgi:hypothetical protein
MTRLGTAPDGNVGPNSRYTRQSKMVCVGDRDNGEEPAPEGSRSIR